MKYNETILLIEAIKVNRLDRYMNRASQVLAVKLKMHYLGAAQLAGSRNG